MFISLIKNYKFCFYACTAGMLFLSVGSTEKHSSGWYLQKTLPGGIVLIELRFREVFFCVSVYAYEWRPMSDGRKINAQVLSSFCTVQTLIAAFAHIVIDLQKQNPDSKKNLF